MLLKEYCRLQAGFYLPSRLQGAVATRYLSPSSPLVRFSPHYVLSDGISLLDIGAGVGVASALAARTPSVRITAIELDALSRRVLRINFALLLPHACSVPTPPPLPRDALPLCDGSVSSGYEKFLVDIIAGAAPDVIRLSDSHAGSFLPIVCRPSPARYIMVERHSCDISFLPSQVSALFPSDVWSVKPLSSSRGGSSGRSQLCKCIFVARRL